MQYITRTNRPHCPRALSIIVAVLCVTLASALPAQTLKIFYDHCSTVFLNGSTHEQRALVDSLQAHPSTDPDERMLGKLFVARGYRIQGKARMALMMMDSIGTDPEKGHSVVRYALCYERSRALKQLKMSAEAMEQAQQAHRFAVAFALPEEEVNCLVLMAELHRSLGEYGPSLEQLINAEKRATTIGFALGTCNVAINRGNLLNVQGRYAEALDAYRLARACATQKGFTEIAGNALFNEAGILTFLYPDSMAARIAILRQGLTMATASGDREFEADLHGELGRALNEDSRSREARGQLHAALAIYAELGDTLGRSEKLLFLSSSYLVEGALDSALTCAQEATKLSERSGDRERTAASVMRTGEILAALGRHKEASVFFREFIDLQEALTEAKNGEAIKVMEYRFETGKKENTIRLQSGQIESDKIKKRGMLVILALLALASALAVRNNQHMRKVNAQRVQLHEREVNDLLKQQEIRALDAMMQGQELERTRIAKDLHDRLGSMLSAIKLQFSALENQVLNVRQDQERQYKQVFSMLDEAVGEVRRIAHDLLITSLSRFGLKGALEDLRNTLQVPGKMDVDLSLYGLEERLEQRVEVAIFRVVQECIGNALKHAQASTLAVQLTRSRAMINIIVEDNGKGFDPAQVKEGMGMGNLRQRAAELGGVVRFDSKPERGTVVNIDIPLAEQGASSTTT